MNMKDSSSIFPIISHNNSVNNKTFSTSDRTGIKMFVVLNKMKILKC